MFGQTLSAAYGAAISAPVAAGEQHCAEEYDPAPASMAKAALLVSGQLCCYHPGKIPMVETSNVSELK
jgi:hypothetical protein